MSKTNDVWKTWSAHRAFRPVLVGAGVVVMLMLIRACGTGGEEAQDQPVFMVESGPLTISVTESGSVKAREQVVIKSEVEGQTSVLYVMPEGTRVTNGTLLVELDGSELQDDLLNQQIQVENAEAAFITAEENVEVVKNQAQSDVEKAELDRDFALLDLKKYTDGEYLRDLNDMMGKIALASQTLETTAKELTWSRTLFEEEYLSETELRTDETTHEKAKYDLALAEENLRVLVEYTNERTLTELKSNVRQTEMALERAQRKASADVVQAEASLRAKESEFARQKSRLDKLNDQIGKTKIYAPSDGLVVYATSARGGWRGNDEPMAEGRSVREREELIYLPTAYSYMADVKIHESALQSIRLGLPAKIKVDAVPGEMFSGRVAKIAPLPDASSMFWNPDLKVYPAEIHLDEDSEMLKTGMNCEVEIFIAHYTDAVFVPIQAVLRIGGTSTVYVAKGKGFEPRPVELGLDNNRMVHVASGLENGDRVLLTPPLQEAEVEEAPEGPEGVPVNPDPEIPMGPAGFGGQRGGDPGQGERPPLTEEQRQEFRRMLEQQGGGDAQRSPGQRRSGRERMRQDGGPGGRSGGSGPGGAGGGGAP